MEHSYIMNKTIMLKSFLTSALRNLKRNPIISSIHILGFSLALGCCLVCYQFIEFQMTMDSYHENGDKVFMVTHETSRSGSRSQWPFAPLPLGSELKENFEQVEAMTWIIDEILPVKYRGELINQEALFVTSDFFNMFSFPTKSGSVTDFEGTHTAVISEVAAFRYFGKSNSDNPSSFCLHLESFASCALRTHQTELRDLLLPILGTILLILPNLPLLDRNRFLMKAH